MQNALERVRCIADYQFGRGVGDQLFPENVEIVYSKATGRIRYVNFEGKRLATLRPTNGLFALSIAGAQRIVEKASFAECFVKVQTDVSQFVANGSDVFAAHVCEADDAVHAKNEVIVVDENNDVLAVGRATLSSIEMKAFKAGVAVKVRHATGNQS